MPTFSKMPVTFWATHPAICEICQASGSAMATVPTATRPCSHSVTAIAPIAATWSAFSIAKVTVKPVVRRNWRRNAAVCSSTDSRTNWSSSAALANNLTVRMLV